jgi:hypothetical protein
MRKTLCVMACLAAPVVWAGDCDYKHRIETTLDIGSATQLEINAAAGDLKVSAGNTESAVRIEAVVCASREEWASDSRLALNSGETAEISVLPPDSAERTGWGNDDQFSVDLDIRVPAGLAVNISDSSGGMTVEDTGDLSIRDSSGDIDVRNIRGMVRLEDSSGDIDLQNIEGDVVVESDSSGNMFGKDIQGSVLVMKDSSGNIWFEQVRDDFVVERDSSGNIVAEHVGGDFRVLKDGSGNIRSSHVAGEIEIPDKG